MSEAAFHKQVAGFLASAVQPPAFWTTFPAGGGGRTRGARLKACGMIAGVPDILVVHNGQILGVELKTAKGRVSYVQQLAHARLRAAGAYVVTCRSLAEVEGALLGFGVPLSARVAA